MKQSLFSEDQIVRMLRRHDNKEAKVEDLCREAAKPDSTPEKAFGQTYLRVWYNVHLIDEWRPSF